MAQNQDVLLSIAGLYTAPNDFSGVPPGAMDEATNVAIDNKNILSSRHGFGAFGDTVSSIPGVTANRITTFSTSQIDSIQTEYCITRLSDNTLERSAGPTETDGPWYTWPGSFENPASDAKLRFFETNRRKYVLTSSGPRLLDIETAGEGGNVSTQAGVPKALDLIATAQSTPGFLQSNVAATPTATATSSSLVLTKVSDLTDIEVDMYASAPGAFASKAIQDLTYTSIVDGTFGNSITVANVNAGISQPLSVQVSSTAITVTLATNGSGTPTSTANAILAAINGSAASGIVTVAVTGTGTTVQTVVGATALTGGAAGAIPAGTKVASITDSAPLITETGNTTAGANTLANLTSNAGIVAGVLLSGAGIPDGTKVVSISGAGPYSVVMSQNAYQTTTGVSVAFATAPSVTLTVAATATVTGVVTFYRGSQIGYRLLFIGRDAINTALLYGAPTGIAIAVNTAPSAVAVSVTTNLPSALTMGPAITLYVQLYRSDATASAVVPPLDQMQLVYEAPITAGNISAGRITILDQTPDSLKGIPLYTGSDREGILQANDPPPLCKDATVYRDMTLYANVTSHPSLKLTLLGVTLPGGSGLQAGDTITLTPDVGTPLVLTAVAGTPSSAGEFKIITSGTPAQNIADTANNLISTINYAPGLSPGTSPIYAYLISGAEDLPGQILLVSKDYSGVTVTASLHGATAWSPSIASPGSALTSTTTPNAVLISKQAQGTAVPTANQLLVGDASAPVIRVLALREYALVAKTDGVYRITGLTPSTLSATLFDNTTRIVGAETAVVLSNALWMLSNQGVVSVSDTGTQIRSEPIKNIMDFLVGPLLETTKDIAFATAYETQKKYILAVPTNSGDTFAKLEYVFNYSTNTWVDWSRKATALHVSQGEDRIFIGNALSSTISKERNDGTNGDFCDEDLSRTITAISGSIITLDSVADISQGDVLQQSASLRATIVAIDPTAGTVLVEDNTGLTVSAVTVKTSIHCRAQWKPIVNGGNPMLARQYSEGVVLFRNTQFNFGEVGFFSDADNSIEYVPIEGTPNASWGFFAWGDGPFGGAIRPQAIRFLVPEDKQYASQLVPILVIQNALSTWTCQGISISANRISQEVPSVDAA